MVPERIIISGLPSCEGLPTYRRDTSSCRSKGEKSVRLDIHGSLITAMSMGFTVPEERRSLRLSSSSISTRV